MTPRIVTFYSYKGGTGRSMALANVAWALASNGYRVLAIDWDLEAPGLHRYFRPFLVDKDMTAPETTGVIEFVRSYAARAATPTGSPPPKNWYEPYADLGKWGLPLRSPNGQPLAFEKNGGEIMLVPAGRQDSEYGQRVNSFAWDRFYSEQSGGAFLDAVREKLDSFDYVLIDSRTGISDTSGICTIQMPHVLVVCYTYNIQSIEGASRTARSIRAQRPELQIFPVAMRVEYQQAAHLKTMREFARNRFHEFVEPAKREAYFDAMEVPYWSQYAYSERIASFDDRPASKESIYPEMIRLAGMITDRSIQAVPVKPELKEQVLREAETYFRPQTASSRGARPHIQFAPLGLAALALFLAIVLGWSVLSEASPVVRRARLLISRVQSLNAETASRLGVLLEDGGLPDSPEARALYSELLATGIPVFFAADYGVTSPSGQRVITCGAELNVYSIEGKRLFSPVALADAGAGVLPLGACVPVTEERALVMGQGTVALYDWSTKRPTRIELATGQSVVTAAADPAGEYVAVLSQASNTFALPPGKAMDSLTVYTVASPTAHRVAATYRLPAGQIGSAIRATRKGFVLIAFDLESSGSQRVTLTRLPYAAVAEQDSFVPRSELPMHRAIDLPIGSPIALNAAGTQAAIFRDEQIVLLDVDTQRVLRSSGTVSQVEALTFDPSDNWLAVSRQGRLELRRISNLDQTVWSVQASAQRFVTLNADATVIGISSYSGTSVYRRDRNPPPAVGAWNDIIRNVRAYTSVCMPVATRQQILLSSPEAATRGFDACEASQGRKLDAPQQSTTNEPRLERQEIVDARYQEQGMKACPKGFAVGGANLEENRFLCRRVTTAAQESRVVTTVDGVSTRENARICPSGTYVRGIHVQRDLLLCSGDSTGAPDVRMTVDGPANATQTQGMHACPSTPSDYSVLVGLNLKNNQFLCARVDPDRGWTSASR
jgi:hypothetical protein